MQFEKNSEILKKYLPEKCVTLIAKWIVEFDFKLKIKKDRITRLGDYTSPRNGLNHIITINYNLNKYAFLITLVHEIAHLITFNENKNRVNPHGIEWKRNFQKHIEPFLNTDIFPIDVFSALRKYIQNPAASSCTDLQLLKTLKLYDEESGFVFLEYIPENTYFLYKSSRIFQKKDKVRKRFKCKELKTGLVYLFNPLTEVEIYEINN